MKGWRDLLQHMPDELSTAVSLATAPPAPFIPEEWHNKKVTAVIVCWAGDPAAGEHVVKPLRTLGTPITDLLGPIPYVDLQQLVDPAWEAGAANYFTSAFLDRLPDEAIETLADYHRRSADLPVQAELHIHHLGGAVARVPADSTAFTNRSSPFLLNCARAYAGPGRSSATSRLGTRSPKCDINLRKGRDVCELRRRRRQKTTFGPAIHPQSTPAYRLSRINTTRSTYSDLTSIFLQANDEGWAATSTARRSSLNPTVNSPRSRSERSGYTVLGWLHLLRSHLRTARRCRQILPSGHDVYMARPAPGLIAMQRTRKGGLSSLLA